MYHKILQLKQITRRSPNQEKIHTYLDMLLTGEHIKINVDHWLMFLRLIVSSPEKEFWNEHKEVAHAHWEQQKTKSILLKKCCIVLKSATFTA